MDSGDDPIYVTRPYLPPLEEVLPYLEQIWKTRRVTNGGPFHQELEQALCEYLGVDHVSLFANGTLALVTAMQALRLKGEVITAIGITIVIPTRQIPVSRSMTSRTERPQYS